MPQYAPYNPARPPVQPKPLVVPHGHGHMTPASRHLINLAMGALGGKRRSGKKMSTRVRTKTRRKRKVHAKAGSHRRVKRTRTKRTSKRFVAGSVAAKRHMAKLRAMRKH
jgi:hypothetical protein